jgi:hypothetical protein
MDMDKDMGVELSTREEGSKGVLFMGFKSQTFFLIFIVLSEPSIYSLECRRAQSLNTCKRVGVRSHIP